VIARGPALPRPGAAAAIDDLDLPSPAMGFGLPSVSSGAGGMEFGDDLPSPSYGLDLPSPSFDLDLPSVSDAQGLPAVQHRGDFGFGELDLPIIGGDLPSPSAGLPAVAAGLPMSAAGLPMSAAGLPSPAADDPFGFAGGPSARSGAPPGGSLRPDESDPFGAPPGGSLRPDDPDPFGAPPGGSLRAAPPDPFGAPSGDPFGNAEASPFGVGPADPFGAPPPDDGQRSFGMSPPGASSGHPEAFDPDGEVGEFAPPQEEEGAARPRTAAGGGAYGEVNLDDGGAGVAVEGEAMRTFAAEGPDGALPSGGPAEAPAVARARAAEPAAGGAVAEIQAKRRRQRLRVAVATVVVTVVAGGALTLVPALGPFGSYFIVDQLRRGEYERLLAAASDSAHRSLGADTYPDAEAALKSVTASAGRALRYKPLTAYTAFVGFSRVLRFGGESDIYARAKVSLEELAGAHGVDKVELAQATKAAVDGEVARSRQLLGSLARSSPKDIDVAVVRGELELKARDAQAAVVAWKAAAALEKSARTAYGLGRAMLAAGDVPAGQKLAEQAIQANPNHVGARLLLAEAIWSTKRDDAVATKLIDEILRGAQYAGPEERIEAQTLLGEIHLNRGRVTQAEAAFGEAIKIAEVLKASARAARALGGLGEALFIAGRYSQAIARFKAAAQADPDDIIAQVGVAKSSIELERLEEARDMLVKLRKSHPKDMHVNYWHGRVQEALGDRKEAESAYRDAIAAGKGDPESVHAYISLANVLSQAGQLDAAHAALAEAQTRLPASSALHKALGRVAMTQGRYPDGLVAFEHAMQIDADDLEAKFLVGTAFARQRQFERALEVFDAVGKVDRDFPGLALERGFLFQESGRTEEALREYETALAKAPNDPDLMLRVGCGKAESSDGAAAEKLLRKVLEQRPTSAETQFCLGRALMVKRDLNDAIKAFERAIQIDPNHAQYHLYVGWACNEGGFIAKASAALKRALELDQGLADAYWQRGILRVHQTRPKDAIADLTKALELRPSRFEAHADLALAYYDLGQEDLALAEWQKAIAANPNEPTWRFHYGKLLSLRLQNAAAAEQLKKAVELAEAKGDPLPWVSEAHRLCALSLGASPAAVPHWQAFLKIGAINSPYRSEAKGALRRLGAPWEEE
jgi:tetratricopeptide (TPR) repeat protein